MKVAWIRKLILNLNIKIKNIKYKKAMREVLKNPPLGQEIKKFEFKKLSGDDIFVLNIKLQKYDIGLTNIVENGFHTYLISEFKAAEARMKRMEENKKQNRENEINFKAYLKSKDILMSDYDVERTVDGRIPFTSHECEIYKEYLGSQFSKGGL